MRRKKELRNALFALTITVPAMATGGGFNNMYVLGDSLSDQGNLFHAIESLGYPGIPRTDHYWNGRFADGGVWSDVLVGWLDIPLEPSILNGTNFADGGARVDYNTVESDATKPFPVNLLGQGGFLSEDRFPWTLEAQRLAFTAQGATGPDALYVVFAGANDLSDLIQLYGACLSGKLPADYCDHTRGDPNETIPLVIGGISNAIGQFVAAGARDILVPNMPNLGVIPVVQAAGPQAAGLAAALSEGYNVAFAGMLAQWDAIPGVNIIPFDTYGLITNTVQDPEAVGFSNATDACYTGFVVPEALGGSGGTECSNPDEYVFWDFEHPTAAFHAYLAEQFLFTIVLDILDDLKQQVGELDANSGVKSSLTDKLEVIIKTLTDENGDNDNTAIQKLGDFISIVEAKQGKKILESDAFALIKRAEQVIALLEP